jgi:hypothetical protein
VVEQVALQSLMEPLHLARGRRSARLGVAGDDAVLAAALAEHPAFLESVARLRSWGVTVLFEPETHPLPTPNLGPEAAELFPWAALVEAVEAVRIQLG